MPGIKNIVLGIVLLGAAGAGLYYYDFGNSSLVYAVWGAVAVGGIMVVGGLREAMAYEDAATDAEEVYKSDTIARLVMQSTILTALADGPLDDEETEMIATACETVLHEHIDKESIAHLAELIAEKGDAILEEIHSEGRLLNLSARKAVIDACVLVLVADGRVDERQTEAVKSIARHMDFSEEETREMIDKALADNESK